MNNSETWFISLPYFWIGGVGIFFWMTKETAEDLTARFRTLGAGEEPYGGEMR